MTNAQSQQLLWHLQHRQPQEPDGGFGFPFLALGVSARVCRAALIPVPVALSLPLLHVVDVVHAARGLDQDDGVGSAEAVAVRADFAVVGEGVGGLPVEHVPPPPHGVGSARLLHAYSSVAVEEVFPQGAVRVRDFVFVQAVIEQHLLLLLVVPEERSEVVQFGLHHLLAGVVGGVWI